MCISVLLAAYIPSSARKLLDALGAPGVSLSEAQFAERGSGRPVTALDPLFPKQ